MHFTREPIILSVITPKEGCKLAVKNASGKGEDFFVDALEVVAFNSAIFYRSTERPKSFIVPTNAYEVVEVKETKMVLQSHSLEKPIKIGGKQTDEPKQENIKKEQKKNKRRRPSNQKSSVKEQPKESKGGGANDESSDKNEVSSSVLKKLFPPPNTLIKEKLARFKNEEFFEENILPLADEDENSNVEKDIEKKEKTLKEKDIDNIDIDESKKINDQKKIENEVLKKDNEETKVKENDEKKVENKNSNDEKKEKSE